MKRKIYEITGIVQGVGFRPTVFCLAEEAELGGWIKNCTGMVMLALEGNEIEIDNFISTLKNKIPKQAKIDSIIETHEEECPAKSKFKINESEVSKKSKIAIPADLAMCDDCRSEILDKNNRRYLYPFTTCINCGPRYTVVNSMPYDRCRTTLNDFPLCQDCLEEYTDPKNRRFHAESTACPKCGPKLFCTNSEGKTIQNLNVISEFKKQIKKGKIIAVRGIGGFLLTTDAKNRSAIIELRKRKNRPSKPFAVMAKDIETAKKYCIISDEAEKLLCSASSPIIILQLKKESESLLPIDLISPDSMTIGMMIPYSPLHMLLFDEETELLIMTSGNKSGEPICIKNDEAFKKLNGIADEYLCHNREINLRNDDSIFAEQTGVMQIWRRARGFAPNAIKISSTFKKNILAMGSELKNSIALGYDNEVIMSPHIGDLSTPEAIDGMKQVAYCLPEFLNKKPEIIAVDLHPDMHSTRLGNAIGKELNIKTYKIQHHHAHAAACMAEHNINDAIAVVFDGTGLGTDNTIWGAEFFSVKNRCEFNRFATFEGVLLPGGDKAVTNPIRQLHARLRKAGITDFQKFKQIFSISDAECNIWNLQYDKKINAPITHSAGRLFDAFSVLIGASPKNITYEGQAAIRLESEAEKYIKVQNYKEFTDSFYTIIKDNGLYTVSWDNMFKIVYKIADKLNLETSSALRSKFAYYFHEAVSDSIVDILSKVQKNAVTNNVVLSGGVFMNRILTSLTCEKIKEQTKLTPFIHINTPPNDGSISLGQSVIANAILKVC